MKNIYLERIYVILVSIVKPYIIEEMKYKFIGYI